LVGRKKNGGSKENRSGINEALAYFFDNIVSIFCSSIHTFMGVPKSEKLGAWSKKISEKLSKFLKNWEINDFFKKRVRVKNKRDSGC
jgi:hypothetical protein